MTKSEKKALSEQLKDILDKPTTDKAGKSIVKAGIDIGAGVLAGGAVTALMGKYAFAGGALVSFIGHYKDINWLKPVGVGMMASSFLIKNTDSTVKERFTDMWEGLKKKTFLDKVLDKTSKNKSTQKGVANQSGENASEVSGVNVKGYVNAIDEVEKNVIDSANEFARRSNSFNPRPTSANQADNSSVFDEQDFSGF